MSSPLPLSELEPTLRRASVCHDQCLFACWALRTSGKQTAAPSRRAWLAQLVNSGTLSWQDSGMVETFYLGDTSGLQREHCVCSLDEAELLWAARREIVRAGQAPAEILELDRLVAETGVPFAGMTTPLEDSYAPTSLFVDASTRYLHPAQTRQMGTAFQQLGLGLVLGGSSGFEAFDVGLGETAEACARELIDRVAAHGVDRLVVDAPAAVFMLRKVCGDERLEVLHTSEYLDQNWRMQPATGLASATVTVQDSALLARYCDLTEAPRRLLARLPGVQVVEMPTSRTLANPTGGRLWPPEDPRLAPMAEARVAEAATTGADTVITLGPYDKRNLTEVAERRGLRVLDLTEFILERATT